MLIYSWCGPNADLLDLVVCFKQDFSPRFCTSRSEKHLSPQGNQSFLTSDLKKAEEGNL